MLARLTGKPASIPEEAKSVDIPQMELLFSTVPLIEGKEIVKHFGLISVEAVVKEEEKEKSSFFNKLIKNNGNGLIYKLGEARNEALKNLETQAKEIGANAILGVNIGYGNVGGLTGSTMVVTVSGNAVLYK